MIESDRICAGIVLYNPDIDRLRRVIDAIIGQVNLLILVDNGSTNIDKVKNLASIGDKIFLIKNIENVGIATALNQICKYGFEKGYNWCLTLDHDTICDEGMVDCLLKGGLSDNVGIVCPSVLYEELDIKVKAKGEGNLENVYACMTSGSLTRLDAWKNVGGFNDSYFIDFVDNEFCMKLRLRGYIIVRNHDCVMKHSLGEAVRVRSLFGYRNVSIHRPWRYYYMVRNNLAFIKQYGKHLNVFKEYGKLLKIIYGGLRHSYNRGQTWMYIKQGIYDANHGVSGKMRLNG